MLIIKYVTVEGTEYPVTISDDREALSAAHAAGGAIVGIWKEHEENDGLSDCLYLVTAPECADEELLSRAVRRHLGLPFIIGETRRLLIREFTKDDPLESEQEAAEGKNQVFSSRDKRNAYIDNQYRFHECGLWALVEKKNGQLIGKAGIEGGELGYHIYRPFRTCGYAMEACQEILSYGRKIGLSSLFLRIDEQNHPSISLAGRLGFQLQKREGKTLIYVKKISSERETDS